MSFYVVKICSWYRKLKGWPQCCTLSMSSHQRDMYTMPWTGKYLQPHCISKTHHVKYTSGSLSQNVKRFILPLEIVSYALNDICDSFMLKSPYCLNFLSLKGKRLRNYSWKHQKIHCFIMGTCLKMWRGKDMFLLVGSLKMNSKNLLISLFALRHHGDFQD